MRELSVDANVENENAPMRDVHKLPYDHVDIPWFAPADNPPLLGCLPCTYRAYYL